MKIKNSTIRGFTLLEIMVVVAIISIMTPSMVLGFSSFGKTIQIRETAGTIEDLIKKLELEITQGNGQKTHLYFEKNFLIAKTENENSNLKLKYKGLGVEGCEENEIALEIGEGEKVVYLIKKDAQKNNLEITVQNANEIKCISDFQKSKELEWEYKTNFNTSTSDSIRFIHFNLNRTDFSNPIEINEGTEYSLEINAPYGKKLFYKKDLPDPGPLPLIIKDTEGNEEVITID